MRVPTIPPQISETEQGLEQNPRHDEDGGHKFEISQTSSTLAAETWLEQNGKSKKRRRLRREDDQAQLKARKKRRVSRARI